MVHWSYKFQTGSDLSFSLFFSFIKKIYFNSCRWNIYHECAFTGKPFFAYFGIFSSSGTREAVICFMIIASHLCYCWKISYREYQCYLIEFKCGSIMKCRIFKAEYKTMVENYQFIKGPAAITLMFFILINSYYHCLLLLCCNLLNHDV